MSLICVIINFFAANEIQFSKYLQYLLVLLNLELQAFVSRPKSVNSGLSYAGIGLLNWALYLML